MPIDLVVPLGTGSRSNNDELRILLRSVEKNAINIGRVIVVTDNIPLWLKNVTVIKLADRHKHNKDANIIDKVIAAAKLKDISEQLVWTADDCAFLQKVDLATLPYIENRRGYSYFKSDPDHRWKQRVAHTYEYFESMGVVLEVNFDSHTPQRCDSKKLLEVMRNVNYQEGIGYSIGTLFAGLLGARRGEYQGDWKVTLERVGMDYILDKTFCGYSDGPFLDGLREKLFELFPEKSSYEV